MLLFSSITYGFAVVHSYDNGQLSVVLRLVVTGLFSLVFLVLRVREFTHLWHIGATPIASVFLSSFFVLVGTHGLHARLAASGIVCCSSFRAAWAHH